MLPNKAISERWKTASRTDRNVPNSQERIPRNESDVEMEEMEKMACLITIINIYINERLWII